VTTIYDAIQEIQAVVSAVPGIRLSPDAPPDQIAAFPAAICYSRAADWTLHDATFWTALHTIVIEIHAPRQGLARAVAATASYGDLITKAIYAAFVAGTFTTFQAPGTIRGEFLPMKWDTTDTIGWRLFIENVKIQSGVAS